MPCYFSVIMPAYNTEEFVKEALESLFAQDCQDFEIIFIDDGSTDATLGIASDALTGWGGKFEIIRRQNQGPGKARNSGMALANGVYLYFMDSDDVTRPFLFSRILKEIANTPDFIFSAWERIGEAGEFLPQEGPFFRNFPFSQDPARRLEQFLDGEFYSLMGATFFRREFVENLEIIFPANIARGEDDVFIQQCLLFSESVIVIPEKLVLYRKRKGSITDIPVSISLKLMFQGRIAQSLRLLGTIRRKALEMPDFESSLKFRARQNIFLLVRNFLLSGRKDLALRALGNKVIRRNLLDLVRSGEHEFEHRFKSGLALWFPTLFLLWYRNR